MNAKHARFVEEYLIDLNGTQAAIRAGYSERTAQEQSSRLLSNVMVAKAIAEAQESRAKRTEITQDRVIRELAKIGFADIRKAVRWANELKLANPLSEEEGAQEVLVSTVLLVPSDEIDDDTAAAIAEISNTAQGVKIKLYDKKAALVDLGKHLGMFVDRTEHSVSESLADLIAKSFEPKG